MAQPHPLYLLAFILTTNHELAERCFVSGLENSVSANDVFRGWAHSWARRKVINNAIREVFSAGAQLDDQTQPAIEDPKMAQAMSAIACLTPIERFVLVMSFIEGYSDGECAALLGLSREQVLATRKRISASSSAEVPCW